jgi:hypothetical protein
VPSPPSTVTLNTATAQRAANERIQNLKPRPYPP